MPQLELTRGEYGLEGEIRLPAWEHWQIQEQARPIRVDFGGDRVEEGLELTESYRTALAYIFAGQEQNPKCHSDGDFGASGTTGGRPFERRDGG